MEYVIVILVLILIAILIFAYGEYINNKELEIEIDEYRFCCDCVAKLNNEEVYALLVNENEVNTSIRLKLSGMGYKLTDEKEIPVARLPHLIRIEPWMSKLPIVSVKECSSISNYE